MSKVIFDISMSLDGFITAANQTSEDPMGQDTKGSSGQILHQWAQGAADGRADVAVPDTQRPDAFGALVCGRRTYETSLPWWGPDGPSGELRLPLVVVAHQQITEPPPDGIYSIASGIDAALTQAQEKAGGKDISVMGGASIGGQFLTAGLLDEIKIHLVPVVLGSGTPLFAGLVRDHVQLEQIEVQRDDRATHLRYRVASRPTASA